MHQGNLKQLEVYQSVQHTNFNMFFRKIVLFFIVCVFTTHFAELLFSLPYTDAQKNAKITAAMISNFCSFTDWPNADETHFKIAVIGNHNIQMLQKDFESLQIKGKHLKFYTDIDGIDLKALNALFIGENIKKEATIEILEKSSGLPLLIITPREFAIDKGSVVGIYKKDNKFRFIVNHKELKKRKLRMRSHVLKLAEEVIY